MSLIYIINSFLLQYLFLAKCSWLFQGLGLFFKKYIISIHINAALSSEWENLRLLIYLGQGQFWLCHFVADEATFFSWLWQLLIYKHSLSTSIRSRFSYSFDFSACKAYFPIVHQEQACWKLAFPTGHKHINSWHHPWQLSLQNPSKIPRSLKSKGLPFS